MNYGGRRDKPVTPRPDSPKAHEPRAEKVTISKQEYEYLLDVAAHMDELDARGVDNWGGYVGSYNYCNKCDTEFNWSHEKCPECGEFVPDDWY